MGVKLPQEISGLITPACLTGRVGVYQVMGEGPDTAVEAIQYADGDGGVLVAKYIPGIEECATKNGVIMQEDTVHGSMLIPFREKHHDAVELGHHFKVVSESNSGEITTHEEAFGYLGLVQARQNLAQAKKTYLVSHGPDRSGGRLLVEIFTHESDDRVCWESTGVKLIKAGLSFPTAGAPPQYTDAVERAKESSSGIWKFGEVLNDEQLKPWVLKRHLVNVNDATEVELHHEEANYTVKVKNAADHLNESHLMIGKSSIPGAGNGLFLRPKPPGCTHEISIPAGNQICMYSVTPVPPTDQLPANTDYLFEVEVSKRTWRYNPLIYDGQNIGRYINQVALLESLERMYLDSDRQSGQTTLNRRDLDEAAVSKGNVGYKKLPGHDEFIVVASKKIVLTNKPIELLGSYGIVNYWVPYTLSHLHELNPGSPLVKAVLWCLFSRHSNWSRSTRHSFTEDHDLPEEVTESYRDMPCPYTLPHSRRR